MQRSGARKRMRSASTSRKGSRSRSRRVSISSLSTVRMGTLAQIPSMRLKLLYGEKDSLQATVGAYNESTWRTNSVYDPRYAVGGGQPAGFDQYIGLYRRFVVHGCKVTVNGAQQYGAASGGHIYMGFTGGSAVTFTNAAGALGTPGVSHQHIGPGDNNINCVRYLNLDKARGLSVSGSKSDDSAWGTVAANPTASNNMFIIGFSGDTATTVVFVFTIVLEYDVEFFDRNQVLD